jgi:hypothetical protein
MLHRLRKIYSKERFIPSFIGIFINPLYFARWGLYKGLIPNKKYLKRKILDFSCCSKPYKVLFDVQEYIGLDIKKASQYLVTIDLPEAVIKPSFCDS